MLRLFNFLYSFLSLTCFSSSTGMYIASYELLFQHNHYLIFSLCQWVWLFLLTLAFKTFVFVLSPSLDFSLHLLPFPLPVYSNKVCFAYIYYFTNWLLFCFLGNTIWLTSIRIRRCYSECCTEKQLWTWFSSRCLTLSLNGFGSRQQSRHQHVTLSS